MVVPTKTKKAAAEANDLFRDVARNTNKTLKLVLPIPTSINKLYVNRGRGKRGLHSDALKYTRIARALINEAVEMQRWKCLNRSEWLYVDMTYYFPDRKIRDASNCIKLLMDVMQDIVYENDYYALPRIQGVEYDKDNPRVEVRVSLQSDGDRKRSMNLLGTGTNLHCTT